MQLYQVYLEENDGSFGSLRTVWLLNDEAAADVAKRALSIVAGVDVWRAGKRVVCVRREATELRKAG